jgi:2-methylisocitrate lyase-like PEP mutase family enzyme
MTCGSRLREAMGARRIVPFIGVYDVFSATLAGRYFDALFISGFGFAASHYGLPDIGFIAWPDIVDFVHRVRTLLPEHHLLVDIDDGYSDPEVAAHVVSLLEGVGASAVVLEDQRRPRKCGHFEGRQLLPLEEYVAKLERVLSIRRDLYVVARTDAEDPDEVARRLLAYARAGADAVLADGLRNLQLIRDLKTRVQKPFAFNQIAGGKSPACGLSELAEVGASIAIYSTPCLFAAQAAIEETMESLQDHDGDLRAVPSARIGVEACKAVLDANLKRRDGSV